MAFEQKQGFQNLKIKVMITTRQSRTRPTNALLLTILFIILGIYSCTAQHKQRITNIGYEVSIGIHRFFIDDNQVTLKNIRPLTRGASTGIYVGNDLMSLRFRTGYYSSTDRVKGKLTVEECDLLMDFYLLEFFRSKKNVLDIYLTTGFSYNRLSVKKPLDIVLASDNSASDVPHHKNYQVIGLGIKYIPANGKRLTHFFCEAIFYNSIKLDTVSDMNVFINFGIKKRAFN